MKQVIILLSILFLYPQFIKSQKNLVVNGSFENHRYCSFAFLPDSSPCIGWYVPNLSTPDYLHACIKDSSTIPFDSSLLNFALPHTGKAEIGLFAICIETAEVEHIQSKLKKTLIAGQKYKVSFWVRLAYQHSDYTTYDIGLYFSKEPDILGDYIVSEDNYIDGINPKLTAQISNSKGDFITDTNWVKISGIYTAQGGEKYITIGMFWDNTPQIVKAWEKAKYKQTNASWKHFGKIVKKYLLKKNLLMNEKYKDSPTKNGQHYAYYLIDDVSVVPFSVE